MAYSNYFSKDPYDAKTNLKRYIDERLNFRPSGSLLEESKDVFTGGIRKQIDKELGGSLRDQMFSEDD
tara:strand:- start:331 stop:534 length:204 start_codon:yes stop_codon:yes gene_type:complete